MIITKPKHFERSSKVIAKAFVFMYLMIFAITAKYWFYNVKPTEEYCQRKGRIKEDRQWEWQRSIELEKNHSNTERLD